MARRGYFEHASPNGAAFWRRISVYYKETGYRRWTVGENLEYGQPGLEALEVLQDWLASPPHRANVVSRRFRDAGIGVVIVPERRGRLRRPADDDRHPGRRLPQPLGALADARVTATLRPHPGTAHSLQLPHPGWGGRPFHPPPAASVTPKITPQRAKIGKNVRQHRVSATQRRPL